MPESTSSGWLPLSVVELRKGATYEGIVYDQDLLVRTVSGELLVLFDMAPMIAADVQPGAFLHVIVAVSSPLNLTRDAAGEGSNRAVIDAMDSDPPRDPSARCRGELFERRWCRLKTSTGHFLMAAGDIRSIYPNRIAVGETLSWDEGRLDLMAWKPAP